MMRALRTVGRAAPGAERSRYDSTEFRASATKRQRALVERLRRTYNTDGLALYLGAGVSASAGFPDWAHLVRALLSRVIQREAYGDDQQQLLYEQTDSWPWKPAAFRKAVERVPFQNNRPLIMLARMLREHLKRDLRARVAGTLYFESMIGQYLIDTPWVRRLRRGEAVLDPDIMSSSLINAIAEMSEPHAGRAGIKAIINYNFDDLVDEIIRHRGTPCSTVSAPGDRISAGALPCYHVHGVLPLRTYAASFRQKHRRMKTRGDFVFSEDEYHRQYAEPFRWSNLVQTSLLGAYDGLFVGLSLEDPNIRRLLDSTHRQYPRRRNYAILRRQRSLARAGRGVENVVTNLFEQIESESFVDIGVNVLWVDDFKDIPKLLDDIAVTRA